MWKKRLIIGTALVLCMSACGGSSEPTATFADGKCAYDGPAEFDLDAAVTFTFVNDSGVRDVGFSVWTVPEGATAEEILEKGIFGVVGPEETRPYDVYDFVLPPTARGEPNELTITLDQAGQHAIVCFDVSPAGADEDHAALFTVSDG